MATTLSSSARSQGLPVRLYGEMVALVWAPAGNLTSQVEQRSCGIDIAVGDGQR